MKKIIFLLFLIISSQSYSQRNLKIESTESYELGNIILALTKYGKEDPWDVQKIPPYYNKILTYFKPFKNHPLLDSVNYSRKDWEKFLGFRTDFYAFSFDENGKLKRNYPFNSFGPKEVDKNLDLINDFVKKSNYREFYTKHKKFYNELMSNYKEYYFINQSFNFLDKIAPDTKFNNEKNYVIAISPLVGGQNCHRDIDSLTTVDFPNIGEDLILGKMNNNISTRVIDNHSIFTEMDHGYVNPISEKYKELITKNFNYEKWDNKSGYTGINSFNEYMTWAVYDIFIKENFPKENTDSISNIYWKQNASRGFVAQNLFSKKLIELYNRSKSKKLEDLYKPMLKWSKKTENKISQPKLLNSDTENFITLKDNLVELSFSEPMQKSKNIEIILIQFENGKQTRNQKNIRIEKPIWSKDGKKLSFNLKPEFKQYAIGFHIWNSLNGLYSQNGILLNQQSYILVKK
ncbi:DUF4932 domain-containing protein [Faecalibacter rhinopitheci]|uniref:DUF4932 domain-containing protein n=1 Tax=Faecalibacter rhinopitheci TaxID=2779678 RepID=A0A8J7GA83_9FLAO|nr:DUF4932 domain-containing protein [Faecalibacter rhinopitheci]MBF0598430.1 DUF4932 domain-containing protein [Faecalibacter rhinopitheci]